MAETLPDAPWASGGGGLPDAPWAAAPAVATKPSEKDSSFLPMALSDIPREAYQTTADALSGVKNALLPKSLGGERDIGNEGTFGGLMKTGAGLASAAMVPIAPFWGAGRSIIGHSLEGADRLMREGAVKLYGEDKIRAVERYLGKPEGGTTYEHEKGNADLAMSALAAGRRAPSAVPAPPSPNGPLGVTLSEGQLTRELPAIRREQAAQRGQLGPDAERVAKAFNEQQTTEVAAAQENVAKGLDQFGQRVAESPQEAGTVVSDAIRQEAASRKAGVDQAYSTARAYPGEIEEQAFNGIGQRIKGDLSLRGDPIIIDEKTTPHANNALSDIEKTIDRLRIPNSADPLYGPPEKISGVTLKGVDQIRRRLTAFRKDAWSASEVDGRAASAVVDAFDHQIDSAIRGGQFNGDKRAIQAWWDARSAHADYKRAFSSSGKNDPIGKTVERILGKGETPAAIPNDVADFMYGTTGVNPNTLNVGVTKRLKSILGEQSPEWSAVKQGLFSRLTETPQGVTDWGPAKQAQNLNKFLHGDGKEMAQVIFTPAERQLIQEYAKLQRALEVPKTAVNPSETSTFVVRALRTIGGKLGLLAGAALGHVVLPGMPWGVSEGVGAGIAKVSGMAGDKLQARAVAKQMPLVTDAMKKYQRAVARSQGQLSSPSVGIASANLARSLQPLGIKLSDVLQLQGPMPSRAKEEQQ